MSSCPVACVASFTSLNEPPLLNPARVGRPGSEGGAQKVPNFLAGHLVGLSIRGQMNGLN